MTLHGLTIPLLPSSITQIRFSDADWRLMEEVVERLFPFFIVTDELQGDGETATKVAPLIKMLKDSLSPNGHIRGERCVPDRELSAPILAFRRQLLKELRDRFKFLKGGLTIAEKEKVAKQFLVPAYLTPKYKDIEESVGVGVQARKLVEGIVRRDMKAVLQPLEKFLDEQHRQWKIREGHRRLDEEAGRKRGGGGDEQPKKKQKLSGSAALMRVLQSKPGGGGAKHNDEDDMEEAEDREEQEEKHVSTAAEVIKSIIDNEMAQYGLKVAEALAIDEQQDVSRVKGVGRPCIFLMKCVSLPTPYRLTCHRMHLIGGRRSHN